MTDVMQIPYNLTKIFANDAINDTGRFLTAINTETNHWLIVGILFAFGVIIFLAAKRDGRNTDGQSLIYAGIITTLVGLFLFLVGPPLAGEKLLEWTHLLPFAIITGFAILVEVAGKKYN